MGCRHLYGYRRTTHRLVIPHTFIGNGQLLFQRIVLLLQSRDLILELFVLR